MGQYKHLEDKQYYIDLFDRFTVERCRKIEKESPSDKRESDPKLKIKKKWLKVVRNLQIYFYSGDRYLEKEETINSWMDRDAKKDKFLEETELSLNPCCLGCKKPLVIEMKTLHGHDNEHVLFYYRCNSCRKARAFIETGEEYIPEPSRCSKCNAELKEKKAKREGKKLTILRHCNNCGQNDDYVYDIPKEEKSDPNFAKDRERFCLADEEGKKYRDQKYQLENMSKLVEDFKKREANKTSYDQLETMQKLTVVQLKQLLQPQLESAGYSSLVFSEPKIDQHVIVDFTVEDAKDGRTEYESALEFKKLIKKILYNVNWNLMTDSSHYRLGVLSGQLKGLESEEDLLYKIKKRNPLPEGQVFGKDGTIITL